MDRGLYHGVYNILWLADLLFVLDLLGNIIIIRI